MGRPATLLAPLVTGNLRAWHRHAHHLGTRWPRRRQRGRPRPPGPVLETRLKKICCDLGQGRRRLGQRAGGLAAVEGLRVQPGENPVRVMAGGSGLSDAGRPGEIGPAGRAVGEADSTKYDPASGSRAHTAPPGRGTTDRAVHPAPGRNIRTSYPDVVEGCWAAGLGWPEGDPRRAKKVVALRRGGRRAESGGRSAPRFMARGAGKHGIRDQGPPFEDVPVLWDCSAFELLVTPIGRGPETRCWPYPQRGRPWRRPSRRSHPLAPG